MIKKALFVLTAAAVVVGLTACGEAKQETETTTVQVETTTAETTVAETTTETKAAETETTTAKAKEEETTTAEAAEEETAAEEEAVVEEEIVEEEAADDTYAEQPQEYLDGGYSGTVYADGDGLMLRSGPDSGYEGLDVVPDDTELYIEAEQDGWGYTNYNGEYGWVYLGYLG